MPDTPTIPELFKAKAITTEQVDAAVDAYLGNVRIGAFEISPGYPVHLSEAFERHGPSRKVLAGSRSSAKFWGPMVRTAILRERWKTLYSDLQSDYSLILFLLRF